MEQLPVIIKSIVIDAAPEQVWAALTVPKQMNKWMSEKELEITTDWKVGSPFIIQGDWYKTGFKNTGIILQYEVERVFEYSHLSSLSRLADKPGNYSTVEFKLTPQGSTTELQVTVRNFPTESIYKHLAFYWNVVPTLIKKLVEHGISPYEDY